MSFEVEGKLYRKFETENKTASFQAREFVLEVDGTYPQLIKFQLTQDRCALVDPFNESDQIKVHFDLRGREWNGKYFTNLNAWRVEAATGATTTEAPSETVAATGGSMDNSFPTASDEPATTTTYNDDLPF